MGSAFFFFSKLYLNILAKSWSRSQPHSPPAPMGAGVQPKDKACRTLLPYRHPLELGGSTKGFVLSTCLDFHMSAAGRVPNGDFCNNLVDMTLKTEDLDSERQLSSKDEHLEPKTAGRLRLESYLNKTVRVVMTDRRTLIGVFWCTDREANVILGNCMEHMPPREDGSQDEPRPLGLAMIPGRHIVSMHIDQLQHVSDDQVM